MMDFLMKYSVEEYQAIYGLGNKLWEKSEEVKRSMGGWNSKASEALQDLAYTLMAIGRGNQ